MSKRIRPVSAGVHRAPLPLDQRLLETRLNLLHTTQGHIVAHLERIFECDQKSDQILAAVIGIIKNMQTDVDALKDRQTKIAQTLMVLAARSDEEYDIPEPLLELLKDMVPEVAEAAPKKRRKVKQAKAKGRASGK